MADDATRKLRHDLRTPIGQIIGYAELLAEEAEERGEPGSIPDLLKIVGAARNLLSRIEALVGGDVRSVPAPSDVLPSSFRMPVAPAPGVFSPPAWGSDRPLPEIASAEPAPDAEPAKGHLLVVDDEEQNRDVLCRRLDRRGYRVDAVGDGHAALAAIAAMPFDLVLLDVMMPGLSGVEVLGAIRQRFPASDLPVIMATARGGTDDVVEALRVGANDYVTKPLDFPVVLARVRTQLALKEANDRVRGLAAELAARNRFIRDAFGRYVSDEIATTVLASPEGLNLGGEMREVSILMSDLRGFTAVVESLPPEGVVLLLNNYLGTMADVILALGGTIDEFIGDGILAVFGAPVAREDDAARAIACAVAMQRAMGTVNDFNRAHGLPEVEMGVGVNTGDVVVGNIGSHKRTKYGVVGSAVNLTSRIESLTVGGQVLTSAATLRAAGPSVKVGKRRSVSVKGAVGPLEVHEVLGIGAPFGLDVPGGESQELALAEPLTVSFMVLDGKRLAGAVEAGRLVSLSDRGGTIATHADVMELADIRMELPLPSGGGTAEVYAKVLERSDGTLRVQFTSVSRAAQAVLRAQERG